MSQLSIRNISKRFGASQILRDVSLEVDAGSILTLLGPSGCGKTTLLRIIAGLEPADSGYIAAGERVFYDSNQGVQLPPQQRRLGFVFQDYGLWPHLTVADNVAFPLKMARAPKAQIKQRVAEVLAAVRLSEHAAKLPEKLSGGQKQRVAIARALAAKPALILFDEPLSNLDANLREELGQEIRQLARQFGQTCVNVTHDRREAQLLSDRIVLMKEGVCHQIGRPEELFRTPVDVWAARFLDAGNILPARVIPGIGNAGSEILVPRSAVQLARASAANQGEHLLANGDSRAAGGISSAAGGISNAAESKTGTPAGISAQVLSSLYIDDRYEVLAEVAGHSLKLFADRPLQPGQRVSLRFADDALLPLG